MKALEAKVLDFYKVNIDVPIIEQTVTNIAKYLYMKNIHSTLVDTPGIRADINKMIKDPLVEAPRVQSATTPVTTNKASISDGGKNTSACRI